MQWVRVAGQEALGTGSARTHFEGEGLSYLEETRVDQMKGAGFFFL